MAGTGQPDDAQEDGLRVQRALDALAPTPAGWGPRVFRTDPRLLREFLIRAACPVVCRGYLDGDENWHQLCIAKADAAMTALDVKDC